MSVKTIREVLNYIDRIKKVFIHKKYECNVMFLNQTDIRVSVIHIPKQVEVRYTTDTENCYSHSLAARHALDNKESRDVAIKPDSGLHQQQS